MAARMLRPTVFATALLALVACEEDAVTGDESFATEGLSKSLTLRFEEKDGALALKSSGKGLVCFERFEGIDGERVTCNRDGEKVQVLLKADGASVVVVRDLGKKRGYYACTRKGDVLGAPTEMKCKLTELRPRGTGGLSSPFDASVEGVTVPNTHWSNDAETLLRGMEPRTPEQFDELRALGVDKVLIFKNTTGKDDVGHEIEAWGSEVALPAQDILHVPFAWKDLAGFETTCAQTLDALRFLRDALEDEHKVFFHCTVGEDRTGYLAAMHALIFEGADPQRAFDLEMCERGYSSGNPQKPGFVTGKLADGLTPLYRQMAFLVSEGKLTADLEAGVCAEAPEVPDTFLADPLVCGTSTTLVP